MMKTRRFEVLLCFLFAFLGGCTFTSKDITKPKMFGGDFEELQREYDEIQPLHTTLENLKKMGFKFNDSNIRILVGASAIKFVFGDTVFQGAVKDRQELEALIAGLDQYKAIVIPHKDMVVKADRIYFTRKETSSKGHDARFVILLRDDLVMYRTSEIDNVDKYELAKAWAQGIIDFFGLARDATKIPTVPKNPVQ